MTSPTTMGREPITIVELEQPRCVNRFGVSPCTATGTKCYNTPGTCTDVPNIDLTGSIKWRFVDGRPGSYDMADFSDADNPKTGAIPCVVSVSTSENEINAGSNLDGRSPLGVTGKVTVTLDDFPWNDAAGDFYIADRAGYQAGKPLPKRGNFWALWSARNAFYNDMFLRIYDGYVGQALADMRQRLYVVEKVDGPDGDGKVTLSGLDPLRLAGDRKAEFPRTSALDLFGSINSTTTTIVVFGDERDVSDAFGNTGSRRYIVIGSEIIQYVGYTSDGNGRFTLGAVRRGVLASVAAEHSDKDKVQRAGRYESLQYWLVLNDLLANHTEMPSAFIPLSEWNLEGGTYLPTYTTTRTIVTPTPVVDLAGELTQQGLFYIWWSEYDRLIKMLAVRAPEGTPSLFTDETHLMRGSVLKRDPSIRLTQVAVYYNQIDVFGAKEDDQNYVNRFTAVDGENVGETRAKSIYAPWITSRTQAVQLAVRLLIRYQNVPQFLTFTIDAKDRAAVVGSVLDINTRSIVTTEGAVNTKRWQVISAKELRAGHTYILNCQTYEFIGKFARYLADDAPDYGDASDAQKTTGGWYAQDDGLMPDGSKGYQYQ